MAQRDGIIYRFSPSGRHVASTVSGDVTQDGDWISILQRSGTTEHTETIKREHKFWANSQNIKWNLAFHYFAVSLFGLLVKRGSEVVVARSVKSGGWCPLASLSCKREPPTIKLNSGRLQLKSMLGNRLTVVGLIEGAVQEQASRFVWVQRFRHLWDTIGTICLAILQPTMTRHGMRGIFPISGTKHHLPLMIKAWLSLLFDDKHFFEVDSAPSWAS